MLADEGPALCRSCTIRLVRLSHGRSRWFPLFREPLVLGMRVLGQIHGVDPFRRRVRDPRCRNGPRLLEAGLKERSAAFRGMDDLVHPPLNRRRAPLVTDAERPEAQAIAHRAVLDGRGGNSEPETRI